MSRPAAELQPRDDPSRHHVHDRHVLATRVRDERVTPARRAGGVAWLVKALQDVAHTEPLQQRHLAGRRVRDHRGLADAFDAARIRLRRDPPQHAAVLEVDGDDVRLEIGGHERHPPPRRPQGDRRRGCRGEELAPVHLGAYGLAGREVPPCEPPLDLVLQRPRDVDEIVGELARTLEQRAIAPQVRKVQIGQARLPRAEELAPAA